MKNKTDTSKEAKDAVTFLISNQSFEIDPVDVKIRIDGKLILQQDFTVAGDKQPAQHNWQRFYFSLAEGSHQMVVSTQKGNATLEKTVLLKTGITITIAFWTSKTPDSGMVKGFFTISFNENMVATM